MKVSTFFYTRRYGVEFHITYLTKMASYAKVVDTQVEPSLLVNSSIIFSKAQNLLQAKDDTSRFVGLALLKSLLDNSELVRAPEQLQQTWEALSPNFIDRLLRAQQNQTIHNGEAQNMVDVAVAVLHIFAIILPAEALKETRFIKRSGPLLKALVGR
jgi:hypothetical protein